MIPRHVAIPTALEYTRSLNDFYFDSVSKKTPGNETLIEFELNGKNIMFTPELLSKFSKVFIRRELGSNFELYPNMKMLFVVRDPRSMISARLRFVQSLAARKNQFYAQLQYWYQLNKDLISLCDQYPGKCIIVRYEDLVIRKRLEVLKVITYKQPLTLRIRNF